MPEQNVTQTQPATEPAAEVKETTPAAEPAAPAAEPKEPTAPAAEPKQEPKPEPELTLESYGDLGIVETDEIKINKELNASFKEIALKHKISPEAAKEIAALQYNQIKKDIDNMKLLKQTWEKENQDKYGDNLKNIETKCGRVLAEMDKDGKFQSFLSLVGAEKAPAILGFLSTIGDALLEKGSINPSSTPFRKEKTLEDIFE